jgi:hypothetical protein
VTRLCLLALLLGCAHQQATISRQEAFDAVAEWSRANPNWMHPSRLKDCEWDAKLEGGLWVVWQTGAKGDLVGTDCFCATKLFVDSKSARPVRLYCKGSLTCRYENKSFFDDQTEALPL